MMPALICGSMAYDTIMVFPGKFGDQIHPQRIHILNVSFMVPELRREFGGCAGNIAYNLQLLGSEGAPMATVGHDFAPYRAWLESKGVATEYLLELEDCYTAQAYITTDLDDNQITAFHPGAMGRSHEQRVPDGGRYGLGMISPDGRDGMLEHALQFADADIPFLFDPGQGLPMFDGHELTRFIELASWVTVNDYESGMLEQRTGLTATQIADRVQAYVVTRGASGSRIHTRDGEIYIEAAKPDSVTDPTGCGDAYRAGLLHGLMNDMDLTTTGQIASLMGAIKVAQPGTQNHGFATDEFADRFKQNFGRAL
jgi:adenosine kinase